jgi:hypothetical protein
VAFGLHLFFFSLTLTAGLSCADIEAMTYPHVLSAVIHNYPNQGIMAFFCSGQIDSTCAITKNGICDLPAWIMMSVIDSYNPHLVLITWRIDFYKK